MAITHKPGPATSIVLAGTVPDPPKVPDDVQDRFDSMAGYQQHIEEWWGIYKGLFQRDMDEINRKFVADEATTASSIQSILSTLVTIQIQLTALTGAGGPSLASQVAALTTQFTSLVGALAAHIAARITHGTVGDIVGTTDAQDLDTKRIGFTTPGYGRFWPPVGVGNIASGQTVTIGTGDYALVAGPFTVYGQLIIEGTLVSL